MAKQRITEYDFAWHPNNNKGEFALKLEGGVSKLVTVESPEEFLVIVEVLKGVRVYWFDNGLIGTDPKD
jgi:hypothetical protein